MDAGQVLFRGVLISTEDLHTLTVKREAAKERRERIVLNVLSAAIVLAMIALAWAGM